MLDEQYYKVRHQSAPHFLTFTVVQWVDVFTKLQYRKHMLDCLHYCQEEKGMIIHSWCIMSNHLHLIASAKKENLSDLIRDVKKYSSYKIMKAISENENERRRDWMLRIFREAAANNSRNPRMQFWQQHNHPVWLYSSKFFVQKLNYIHDNPVKSGIVENSWEYLYSSARDYHFEKHCGLLKVEFL